MTSRLRPRGDEGIAALEMALVTVLLLFIGFGLIPGLSMAKGYQRVNDAATAGVRFATALDANGRRQSDGTLRRRPTMAEVQQFVKDSADDQSIRVTVLTCPYSTPTICAPGNPSAGVSGDYVTVRVEQDVDLSLVGSLANALGNVIGQGDVAPQGVVTMSSSSTGRQE